MRVAQSRVVGCALQPPQFNELGTHTANEHAHALHKRRREQLRVKCEGVRDSDKVSSIRFRNAERNTRERASFGGCRVPRGCERWE